MLRTPDTCFDGLPDYPFAPHYLEIEDPELGPLRMHYIDEGERDAPVVLMAHGNPTWSFLYRHMIGPVVAAGYRVIAPDMIGFGKSDKPAERSAYGYDRFVAWMRTFVEALDLSDITLMCQDWGGPINLRVLSEMPERFSAVLAANTLLQNCDPPPLGVPDWPGEAIAAWIESCRTNDDLPLDELIARTCVTRPAEDVLAAYAAPYPDGRYKAGLLQITCSIPIAEGAEGLDTNREAWRFLEQWDKPFLTAFSDSDPSTINWETVFQNRVAGAKGQPHTRIVGAGHFVQEEQGPALAKVLVDFLRANHTN
ncbi:haloalkane dehalogenase [Croceicoccus estronivorus]|nr:haloalkane dehalogenase [Croceicoccus estronivorus]